MIKKKNIIIPEKNFDLSKKTENDDLQPILLEEKNHIQNGHQYRNNFYKSDFKDNYEIESKNQQNQTIKISNKNQTQNLLISNNNNEIENEKYISNNNNLKKSVLIDPRTQQDLRNISFESQKNKVLFNQNKFIPNDDRYPSILPDNNRNDNKSIINLIS